MDVDTSLPNVFCFLAFTNKNGWGRGQTVRDAIANASAADGHTGVIHKVIKIEGDDGAFVDGMGQVCTYNGAKITDVPL